MDKPVVTFENSYGPIQVGHSAFITRLDGHPCQATGEMEGESVQTSTVQKITTVSNGSIDEFETLNTIYQRRK